MYTKLVLGSWLQTEYGARPPCLRDIMRERFSFLHHVPFCWIETNFVCWFVMLETFQLRSFFFQQHGGLVVNQMSVSVSWKWFYMASNSWMSLTASKGVKAQLYMEHKWFHRCHVVLVYLYYPEGLLINKLEHVLNEIKNITVFGLLHNRTDCCVN